MKTLTAAIVAVLLVGAALVPAAATGQPPAEECTHEYLYINEEVEVGTKYEWRYYFLGLIPTLDYKWAEDQPSAHVGKWKATGKTKPIVETHQVKVPNPDYDPDCGKPEVTPEPTPEVTPEPTPEVTPEPTPEVTPEPTPEATPEREPRTPRSPKPEPTPEATPTHPTPTVGSALSVDPMCIGSDLHIWTLEDGVPVSSDVISGDEHCATEAPDQPSGEGDVQVSTTEVAPPNEAPSQAATSTMTAPTPARTGMGAPAQGSTSVLATLLTVATAGMVVAVRRLTGE